MLLFNGRLLRLAIVSYIAGLHLDAALWAVDVSIDRPDCACSITYLTDFQNIPSKSSIERASTY